MAKPRANPNIADIRSDVGSKTPTVALGGFIASTGNGTVRLATDLSGQEYLDIPERAIRHFDEDSESGTTTLYVDVSAVVAVTSTQAIPVASVAVKQKDNGPGGTSARDKCIQKRIEKCKKDPMRTPGFCDSEDAEHVYGLLCDLFGDPKEATVVFR